MDDTIEVRVRLGVEKLSRGSSDLAHARENAGPVHCLAAAAGAKLVAVEDWVRWKALEAHIEPRVDLGRDVADGPGDRASTVIARRCLLDRQTVESIIEVSPRLVHEENELVGHPRSTFSRDHGSTAKVIVSAFTSRPQT